MKTSRKAAIPDEPELLGKRGEDEVRVEVRDVGIAVRARERPLAEPGAAEAAVRDRVERLHGLVAGAVRIGPRVEPGVDALPHAPDRRVRERGAAREQREADGDEQRAARGRVEHGQEDPEVEERAAEVVRLDEHQHRRPEEQEQRPEILEACLREHLALLAEVRGEEDDQEHLRELAGLEAEAARCRPTAGRRSRSAR